MPPCRTWAVTAGGGDDVGGRGGSSVGITPLCIVGKRSRPSPSPARPPLAYALVRHQRHCNGGIPGKRGGQGGRILGVKRGGSHRAAGMP